MAGRHPAWIVVGQVTAAYGVRGWVKLRSFTDPPENLLEYRPWHLRRNDADISAKLVEIRPQGKGFVARLDGILDRDAAAALTGTEVVIRRSELPAPEAGQFFWDDLLGLQVCTVDGTELGEVEQLMETGANDVLIVAGDRRRLIPFISGEVVRSVDLEARKILVDWDPEF